MSESLFEAFFWIHPHRDNEKSSFNKSRVLWHYPDNVTDIMKAFRNIPHFCFPDLSQIHLESVENNSLNENFTFTMKDSTGVHHYGVCYRGLFQGQQLRYDLNRRVFSLALIDENPGWARYYLNLVFQRAIRNTHSSSPSFGIHILRTELPDLFHHISLITPAYSGMKISSREVAVLPLLECFGVERFFVLLSAVLCERRVLFIADHDDRLSSMILAAVSIISPFCWQYILISLLPAKLIDYLAAPIPYIIGIRRYLLSNFSNNFDNFVTADTVNGGLLVIDCDSGDFRTYGSLDLVDLIGDAGSTLKLASDSLERVRAKATGFTNLLLGKATLLDKDDDFSSSGNSSSSRDIMLNVVSDLRVLLNSKPGSNTIQSVASGFFRTLQPAAATSIVGTSESSVEELRVQWQFEAEKIIRDCLTTFFVYIFAPLDSFLLPQSNSVTTFGKTNPGKFGSNDSRSRFNLPAFINQRASSPYNDSRIVVDFLTEFIHSQMFERYCDDRYRRLTAPSPSLAPQPMTIARTSVSPYLTSATPTASATVIVTTDVQQSDEDDLFGQVCSELASRRLPVTVVSVKQVVMSSRSKTSNDFHSLTVKLTAASTTLGVGLPVAANADMLGGLHVDFGTEDLYFHILYTNSSPRHQSISSPQFASGYAAAVERVCMEAYNNISFTLIMKTISMRLNNALASESRGNAGIAGLRALVLLRALLVLGPLSVVSYSLNLMPVIRRLLALVYRVQSSESSIGVSAGVSSVLELVTGWSTVASDSRVAASSVLTILKDHQVLLTQRRFMWLCHHGKLPFFTSIAQSNPLTRFRVNNTNPQILLAAEGNGGLSFLPFAVIHLALRPPSLSGATNRPTAALLEKDFGKIELDFLTSEDHPFAQNNSISPSSDPFTVL